MTAQSWGLLALLLAVTLLAVKPLGLYMARVMEGEPVPGLGLGARIESWLYRLCGVDPAAQMGWKHYALALLVFNVLGVLLLYAMQRLQGWLPLNPQHLGPPSADSAFNTAVSFVTNTNWQSYTPETTMSYLTQMAGLVVQNFLSAATGIVVAVALIRGLARHSAKTIGNFWVDVTRATLYVLLPIATVIALALVSQGVIQNLSPNQHATLLQPVTYQQPLTAAAGAPRMQTVTTGTQTLPMGPVASQESIKELGTNGGGFFNANSAHPYENPNAWSNLLEMLAIALIPAALTYTFGFMVGDTRQGWAVLAAMMIMFVGLYAVCNHSEQRGNPALSALGVSQLPSSQQSGGNMEGKEVRFGIAGSTLFSTLSTVTSTGAVNAMHDSYMPIGGMVPLLDMMLGEVVFGGVGSGLYSMLIFAIIGVFIAGLMIGRTPEYLGKKIEAFEMKMSAIAILVMPFIVLTGTAIAVSVAAGRAGVANPGPHGFSEILYAFTSTSTTSPLRS